MYWLVTAGRHEYRSILQDQDFMASLASAGYGPSGELTYLQYVVWANRVDVRQTFTLPQFLGDFLQWFYTYGIEECGYGPFLTKFEKAYVLAPSNSWRARLISHVQTPESAPLATITFIDSEVGVNVVGYAFGQLGIGEDARMAARALLSAGVHTSMVNFPPGSDIPQDDRSMARHVTENGAYQINIFCLTAEETGRYYAERGSSSLDGRYNIGYWPWELAKWPDEWMGIIALVDEVWVSTQHTYDALKAVCSKPLFLMPMSVDVSELSDNFNRQITRLHFKLPLTAQLFCFSFDLRSSVHRKNPNACVAAFQTAFPLHDHPVSSVGLVIKVHRPTAPTRAWEELKTLAKHDHRIHIIEETLDRAQLLALYAACDSYLSLHRAEGFGRGIAEAIQLGLHVIATGYSGNLDFCEPAYADLVRYRLIDIERGQYPRSRGQQWAEPDVKHAAEVMRTFISRRPTRRLPGTLPRFSATEVGARYRERLLVIASQFR